MLNVANSAPPPGWVEISGVANGDPVPSTVPLVAVAYQFKVVPADPVALSVTDPGPQCVPGVVEVISAQVVLKLLTADHPLTPSTPQLLLT